MDRILGVLGKTTLAGLVLAVTASTATAQQATRRVYNPVTGQTEALDWRSPTRSQAPAAPKPPAPMPARSAAEVVQPAVAESAVEQASMLAPYDGCGELLDGCGELVCDTPTCGGVVTCCPGGLYAGFEFTFVKPRFEGNVAFTTTESDGVGNDVISETEFDYDLVLTPRVFAGWRTADGCGLRATWWQFDNEADAISTNPPANGFGTITPPAFGTIDISSNVATDTLATSSHLNTYAIDLEATKEVSFHSWDLGVAGGVRYAFVEQEYSAQLRNTGDVLRGNINYRQSIEGIGPTIELSAARRLTRRASLFSKARGSVLFGDGESALSAGEDLDLTASFTTNQSSNRDDLLSIAEIQLGFRWQGEAVHGSFRRPFVTFAMEGQVWNGAGNATSEDGTLGFFGFTSQIGCDW